ncbi:elongation factor P 5-aminopentanone reductase [Desnuesiella massiliensis]|uniref:elongation factor P 5-aminopentanone reductase n=1 Tax=Desnuesiella massiliensis TaxID=1650662 RepID=UPI0006E18E62|nr:SDR family oxidoreductase [Desnuesiella massiliensis]
MNLKGKVAIVTGASRGIGRSIVIELAKAGANVVINFNNNESAAKETLEDVKALGGYGIIVKGDMSKYKDAKELILKSITTFGKIDILVNNAGVSHVGLFMDMNEDEIDTLIDVNLKGYVNTTHAVVPYFINQKSGSIINISSVWGEEGASCEVIYSATKGAIDAFTKALAKELGPSNIRVNGVAPGIINTEMNKWISDIEKETIKEEIPLNRVGEAEEVGNLVAFLCSDCSNYITGQIIKVDGGWT